MRQWVIILINEASHVLEDGITLRLRCQKQFEDPPRLVNEAEVREVAGLAFLVGWSEDGHESRLSVKAHAPAVALAIVRDIRWPRLRVELPEAFQELPKERVVVVDCAALARIWCEDNE